MEPMEHYVPLRKDFSNFDEVLSCSGTPKCGASSPRTPIAT